MQALQERGGHMYKAKVLLGDVKRANEFVHICNEVDGRIELLCGPYVINAKSIMGIFSLELTQPMELQAECTDEDGLAKKIAAFLV